MNTFGNKYQPSRDCKIAVIMSLFIRLISCWNRSVKMLERAYLSFKKSTFSRGGGDAPRPYTARTFGARLSCLRILVTGWVVTWGFFHWSKHAVGSCSIDLYQYIMTYHEHSAFPSPKYTCTYFTILECLSVTSTCYICHMIKISYDLFTLFHYSAFFSLSFFVSANADVMLSPWYTCVYVFGKSYDIGSLTKYIGKHYMYSLSWLLNSQLHHL